jgi:phospholipase C
MGAREGIKHVVVLMLENRSFDSMLGALYPTDGTYQGIDPSRTNVYAGAPVAAWSSPSWDSDAACIPAPDPGESYLDMVQQLFGGSVPSDGLAPMSGFAANYMAQGAASPPRSPKAVMHYFLPGQLPVLNTLAAAFGVCDQWHASAPCQTWPNRFFTHTGTSAGFINNADFSIPFGEPSIFKRLSKNNRTWRVYFHDIPQSLLLADVWDDALSNFRRFKQFQADVQGNQLRDYTFIEPRYFSSPFDGKMPSDQHPPHDVTYGEQLIAKVYNTLRASNSWKETLLVITYDEHGGCYDHMPPPLAVAPDCRAQFGFNFRRYGVRVPTLLISPYIAPGSKVRVVPEGLPHQGPPYPFDHTSIIATLRILFNLGGPLTGRDAVAPDLLGPLSLALPTNDGPAQVTADGREPTSTEVQTYSAAPPSGIQALLAKAAELLPRGGPGASPTPQPLPATQHASVAQAATAATARVNSFLGIPAEDDGG